MGRIKAHPYIAAVIGALILILIGTIMIQRRSLATPASQSSAWGGGTTLFDPSAYIPRNTTEIPQPDRSNTSTAGPYTQPGTSSITIATSGNQGFNFSDFLAQLSGTSKKSVENSRVSGNGVTTLDPYSLIPTGLLSASSVRTRSESEQELFDYGNNVGTFIQAFDSQNTSMIQVLKGQVEDREDKAKGDAVRHLGRSLSSIGESMQGLEPVPAGVQSAHTALAKGYRDAGAALTKIPDTEGDQAFIAAITAYNSAAEMLTKKYVALALLFSTRGIRFSSEDSGSVFTFTQGSF
ncbi:hypothetical protein HY970_01125 [Candidatus Kaiserbacteria bacterium]|nr:hypothetical protein [Candidatus Kaiserbacteria bacterium]